MRGLWQRWHRRRWQELLSAYLDGQLSTRERQRLGGHLERCATCHRDLEELQATVQGLWLLPQPALPHSFVLSALPPLALARRSSDLSPLLRPVQVAAMGVAIGFLVVVLSDAGGVLLSDERGLALFAGPQFPAPAAEQLTQPGPFQAQADGGELAKAAPASQEEDVSVSHLLYLALEAALLALALLSGTVLLALRIKVPRRGAG